MTTHAAYDCDVLVIGGGIAGLSAAYALTRSAPGTRVTVLEKDRDPARHPPGGDTGVLPSGIHHAPGTLGARCAVRGRAELAGFCADHGIAHATRDELIVATASSELPRLHALAQRGRAHGLPVRELGPVQIAEYEPHLRGLAAVRIATAGVCDVSAVASRLAAEVGAAGGRVRYGAEVLAVDRRPWGVAVRASGDQVIRARVLVNCAGPHSGRVARLAGDDLGVRIVPYREEHYALTRPELVRGLVRPVPDPAAPAPGIRLTRGVDGTVRVGPDTVPAPAGERSARPDAHRHGPASMVGRPASWRIARRHWRYAAEEVRTSVSKRALVRAVQRLLPEVTEDDLRPAPAGVAARAVLGDGTPVDGLLVREALHTVHVLNTPAPAAVLPLGREVARRALESARATGWRPPAVESGHCV
ncbi:L-2-hydroxyglutarate oxidase [Streptomyces sp. NPDC005899]|uniref:L-2-hydroxyglutarate oxidase n=1 Tax=Streptomyces sp. NPDC005899 TaxID=3155716 RepID=UPI0033FE0CF7